MNNPGLDQKLYTMSEGRVLSLSELLDYFSAHGALRVSDLHLKAGSPPIYRIDGDLQKIKGLPVDAATMQALVEVVLTETDLQRLRSDRAVDASLLTDRFQFRINCFHDSQGLAMALRALENDVMELEQIGFPNQIWRDIVDKQQGLVLLTGITGAGKSTTIASFITRIARERPCRIITLEDPIEYRLASNQALISQREVGRDVPSFERGVRDALREDPDVIFVGEMRDRESTAWTLTAAETGHLVFSTLHTRDARGTITRLLDMFPPERQDEIASQLSLGLRYVISQKLIPRADAQGRVVAMEILNNTYALSNLIRLGKTEQVYSQLQTKIRDLPEERMITLERSLAMLVKDGKVTAAEAEHWANDRESFHGELKRVQYELREEAAQTGADADISNQPPPLPRKK